MAGIGETIENPLTGERVTWVETAASSAGALLAFDLVTRPGGAVAAAHLHRLQEERFIVRRRHRRARDRRTATAGGRRR